MQLVLAPLGGLILGGICYAILAELFRVKNNSLIGYLVFSAQGFIMGYRLQTVLPSAIDSGGRWIWIAPVCNLAFWLLGELRRGVNADLSAFFVFPEGPGAGGLVLVLITWPAVASCFYSIGVNAASKPAARFWDKLLQRHLLTKAEKATDSAKGTAGQVDKP